MRVWGGPDQTFYGFFFAPFPNGDNGDHEDEEDNGNGEPEDEADDGGNDGESKPSQTEQSNTLVCLSVCAARYTIRLPLPLPLVPLYYQRKQPGTPL